MSTVTLPRKPRGRGWLLGAAGVAALGAVAVPTLLRRPAKTDVPVHSTAVLTVAEGQAGKVGDLTVAQEAMDLAQIKIAPVRRQTIHERLALSGVVQAEGDRLARITPRVAGRVQKVAVVAGDRVQAGQTLAVIESRELAEAQAALQMADARVAAARTALQRQRTLAGLGAFGAPPVEEARTRAVDAQQLVQDAQRRLQTGHAALTEAKSQQRALAALVVQAQTQVGVAQARAERAERLLKEELISRQEWEQAQAERKKADADLEVAQANVARGESTIQSAQAQLAATEGEVRLAQTRGQIAAQGQSRQERVLRGGFAARKEVVDAETALRQAQLDQQAAVQAVRLLGGTPGGGNTLAVTSPIAGVVQERAVTLGAAVHTEDSLFTVVNLDTVIAELQVAPRDLDRVRVGESVTLRADGAAGAPLTGKIVSLGSVAQEGTRAVPVRVAVVNRGGALRPGTFVRGDAVTRVRRAQIVVPEGAIQEHTGRKTLYIALGDQPGAFEVRHVVVGEPAGAGLREIKEGLGGSERIAVSGTFYLKSEALKNLLSDGCCAVETKKE